MFKKKKKRKASDTQCDNQQLSEHRLLIQRMSCQDETKLPPPPLPPTAAPLNRQLQNRDLGEPDPDSPAVKVTRGAFHGSDSYWLHQSQRNANHTCQRVLPVCSRDSLTQWDIPLPAQCQKRWRLALQSAKQTLLQTSAKRGLQKAVRFPVITTLSVLAAP